jgi:hypothetical protein
MHGTNPFFICGAAIGKHWPSVNTCCYTDLCNKPRPIEQQHLITEKVIIPIEEGGTGLETSVFHKPEKDKTAVPTEGSDKIIDNAAGKVSFIGSFFLSFLVGYFFWVFKKIPVLKSLKGLWSLRKEKIYS